MKRHIYFFLILLLSCSQGGEFNGMNNVTEGNKIDAAEIKKLASKKIYFGRQSVGYNIINALITLNPADSGVNIIETSDPEDFSKPVFAHSQNGENTKPETKIAAFVQKMDAGIGNKVDIAFFKFCYVDVAAETDVNKLFNEYKTAMDRLIKKYPGTRFLHVTVPVTTESRSIKKKLKDLIKGIIGRPVTDQVADNIKRMEFNNLLRKEYGRKLFDLAEIESSDIYGKVLLSNKGNTPHHALQENYTFDGGHLNQKSGEIIVKQFLKFINI